MFMLCYVMVMLCCGKEGPDEGLMRMEKKDLMTMDPARPVSLISNIFLSNSDIKTRCKTNNFCCKKASNSQSFLHLASNLAQ